MEQVRRPEQGEPVVLLALIFGVGLIGETLKSKLTSRGFSTVANLGFSWQQTASVRDNERDVILQCVCGRGGAHEDAGIPACNVSVAVVWSAGSAGFASTWEVLDTELSCFRAVVALSARLMEALPLARHEFHFTSSAGGLYEGQLNVGPESIPFPRRPYGQLKLEQERHLSALAMPVSKFIYRPSSVYGFVSDKKRLGLIPTLINNAIRRQVTSIFADAVTLRDYVFVDDVAGYMADRIQFNSPGRNDVFVLASAKPTSIYEVIVMLGRILHHSPYFVFRSAGDNSAPNTFGADAVADGFVAQDLDSGMRSVLLKIHGRFVNFVS